MWGRQPRVTIGMPVHNGGHYLAEAMECLLSQSFEDFELIISDNASIDETEEISRAFAARDRRVIYLRNTRNIGAAANYNRVCQLASGAFFRWAAHDDLCSSHALERIVAVMESDPSVVCCHTRTRLINEDGSPVYRHPDKGHIDSGGRVLGFLDAYDRAQSPLPHQRFQDILMRTRWCFEVFGLMDTQILKRTALHGSYYGSDKVLLAEMALYGRFHEIPEELFLRRCHPRQSSSINLWQRARFIDPGNCSLIPLPQWHALKGYVNAVRRAPLDAHEKALCLATIGRLMVKREKWARLILPGPDNYFGIEFRKAV